MLGQGIFGIIGYIPKKGILKSINKTNYGTNKW